MSRDAERVRDMISAAQKALGHVSGLSREAFLESGLHQDAVVRQLEIVGEAAGRVSDEFRSEHPQIPWSAIAGLRNRLIHAYFEVDLDVVWEIVGHELPPLIEQLGATVPPEEGG